MDDQSACHVEFPDNRVAWNRQTTIGQLDVDAFTAVNEDRFDFLRFFGMDGSPLLAAHFVDQTGFVKESVVNGRQDIFFFHVNGFQ